MVFDLDGKLNVLKTFFLFKTDFSRPIFIDLAVDGPAFGIPGSVGALMVERPADPVEGWGNFFNYS